MDKTALKEIILAQQDFISRIQFTPRAYHLDPHVNYVLVGMRRAGKTFLLYQHIRQLMNEGMPLQQVLFINFGPAEAACCLRLAAQVRRAGISAEVYPDSVKMKKQMQYANATHVQHVALVGEEEMKQGLVTLKNMTTGQQQQLTPEQLVAALQQA